MLAGPGKGHVLVQQPPPLPAATMPSLDLWGASGAGDTPHPGAGPSPSIARPAAPAGAMEPVQPGRSMTRTLSREDVAVSEWKAVSCLRAQVIAASSATHGKVRRLSSWQLPFPFKITTKTSEERTLSTNRRLERL